MDKVTRYVVVLGVVAAASAAAMTSQEPPGEVPTQTLGVLVALTLALVAAGALPLTLRRRAGQPAAQATLEEAVLVAMLVAVPLGIVPWLMMLGTLLDGLRSKRSVVKLAFNTAIAGIGSAAAVLVVLSLRSTIGDDVIPVLAVAALGAAAAGTLQLLGLAGLFHLLEGTPLRGHLSLDGFLSVALGLNVTIGLLLAAAIVADPWLAWLDAAAVAVIGLVLRDLHAPDVVVPARTSGTELLGSN